MTRRSPHHTGMTDMKWLLCATVLILAGTSPAAEPIKVLILDGQNNHAWKITTPILKKILEDTKLFTVKVATAPEKPRSPQKPKDPANAEARKKYEAELEQFRAAETKYRTDMAAFRPRFGDHQVVVSNYNGELWSPATCSDFAAFVKRGGGFVSVHAANNSFPEWPEYNAMIGVGGWGGRNEKSGPYLRLRDGAFVRDESRGSGGSHGRQHEFFIEIRNADHPITRGLPQKWLHTTDELYDRLRGPALHLTVLASAFADRKTGGSGEHEPMLMALDYGKGRVFHTTLGHSDVSMRCVGFQVTFARGCEWAATGHVTQKIPADFPGEKSSSRPAGK